jgi:hypothetical protein
MKKTKTNRRRLPLSLEKPSAAETVDFFATREARADLQAFDKLMKRRRGQPPREGDEIPSRKN